MSYIEDRDELEWYRERFDQVWSSAVFTFSCINVDGTRIPNGEMSFSGESADESVETLYQEGPLSIYRVVVDSPFELLEGILSGVIPLGEDSISVESEIYGHNPGYHFQDGLEESRVREPRPRTEINAVLDVEISDGVEDEYSAVTDELNDDLRKADEPYFDLGSCEGYYFDFIFRSVRNEPRILLFADPGIEFGVTDTGSLEVTAPNPLIDDLFVSILPQRPYHQRKGWRVELEGEELEELGDDRSMYSEQMDLEGIDKLYAVLYLGDQMNIMVEYYTDDAIHENPRYEIMKGFDQANNLVGYLEGHRADVFEIAVLNAFSTAGWMVQWYGEDDFVIPSFSEEIPGASYKEIDVMAYHPENTVILCIECTNTGISEKQSILDRTEAISSELDSDMIPTDMGLGQIQQIVPCVATPQTPEELSDNVVNEFQESEIKILHSDRLKAIYEASRGTSETVEADTQFIEFV